MTSPDFSTYYDRLCLVDGHLDESFEPNHLIPSPIAAYLSPCALFFRSGVVYDQHIDAGVYASYDDSIETVIEPAFCELSILDQVASRLQEQERASRGSESAQSLTNYLTTLDRIAPDVVDNILDLTHEDHSGTNSFGVIITRQSGSFDGFKSDDEWTTDDGHLCFWLFSYHGDYCKKHFMDELKRLRTVLSPLESFKPERGINFPIAFNDQDRKFPRLRHSTASTGVTDSGEGESFYTVNTSHLRYVLEGHSDGEPDLYPYEVARFDGPTSIIGKTVRDIPFPTITHYHECHGLAGTRLDPRSVTVWRYGVAKITLENLKILEAAGASPGLLAHPPETLEHTAVPLPVSHRGRLGLHPRFTGMLRIDYGEYDLYIRDGNLPHVSVHPNEYDNIYPDVTDLPRRCALQAKTLDEYMYVANPCDCGPGVDHELYHPMPVSSQCDLTFRLGGERCPCKYCRNYLVLEDVSTCTQSRYNGWLD
jgi:hypothetical protein